MADVGKDGRATIFHDHDSETIGGFARIAAHKAPHTDLRDRVVEDVLVISVKNVPVQYVVDMVGRSALLHGFFQNAFDGFGGRFLPFAGHHDSTANAKQQSNP